MEIEARINSDVIKEGVREQYHFNVKNINYSTEYSEIDKNTDNETVDFSRLMAEGIAIESQSVNVKKGTTYEYC